MSPRNTTQREVIDRLSIILQPARATMPQPHRPMESEEGGGIDAAGALLRRDRPVGAIQQRYRLYRVCGYGVVSALYYSAKSPSW